MMFTLRRMAIAACAMLICTAGALAQPAPTVKPAAVGGQKTLGLIVAMGDSLTVITRGRNAIDDDERRFSIESWKVGDRVAAEVTSKLGKTFRIKRIPAPAGVFGQLGDPGFFSPDFDENHRRLVKALAGAEQADFYLAISPGYSRVDQGDQIARGLGVVRSETLVTKKDVVYSLVLYRVFDSKFRLIRSDGALNGKGRSIETIIGPNLVLEDNKRLPRDARLTAADGRTRELALALLDKDLASTLPKLFAK